MGDAEDPGAQPSAAAEARQLIEAAEAGGAPLAQFARDQAGTSSPAGERDFHCWLQWLARAQLDAAAAAARAAGMEIGLYLDLAVGPDPAGAEVQGGMQCLWVDGTDERYFDTLDRIGMVGFAAMSLFVLLLVVGFFIEWKRGALEWEE